MSKAAICFSAPEIDASLWKKAQEHNDQLTMAERIQLLKRLDVFGLACAYPDRLTVAQQYQVLGWPKPEVVSENIRAVTDDAWSTVEEVYAQVRADPKAVPFEVLQLLFHEFRARDVTVHSDIVAQRFRESAFTVGDPPHGPAITAAIEIVAQRQGWGEISDTMLNTWLAPETRAEGERRDKAALEGVNRADIRATREPGLAALAKEMEEIAEERERLKGQMLEMIRKEEAALEVTK